MNTATDLRAIQAAADRCTAERGAARTAQIIDDAAELGFSDAQLVTALDAGTTAAARPWYDAPSVQSLIRAARLTDAERALLDARLHAERLCITTPSELRAFLKDLARARVAARVARLSPLPADQLADVAALAGNLARAERAALVAEQADAIQSGTLIIEARGPYGESSLVPASSSEPAPKRGVEEIPAQTPDPNIIPNNDDLADDPDRTLDLPATAPDFHAPASRPDLDVYRPTYPALPGQPAQASQGKLARAKSVLAEAEKKVASKGLAERTVVVAGDLAWVESSDGQARYRVEFEGNIPVFCGCKDSRASFGGCKHADAAHECRQQGDGTYKGTVAPKPRRQHQPSL